MKNWRKKTGSGGQCLIVFPEQKSQKQGNYAKSIRNVLRGAEEYKLTNHKIPWNAQ